MKKIVLILIVFSGLVACNDSEETSIDNLAPPYPVITIDDVKVSYKIGTYSWSSGSKTVHSDSAAPPQLIEGMTYYKTYPNAKLTIQFADEPTILEGGLWEEGIDFIISKNGTFDLQSEAGKYIYVIHASWDEGDGTYVIPIEVTN